ADGDEEAREGQENEQNEEASKVTQANARRPGLGVGNLTVFRGDLSLHRVTPVQGKRKRIVALFSFDQNPGMVFDQAYVEELQSGLP
ncbi:MAG: hypothetical protein AAF420_00485, partial [Pseudomonadota bacterium]